MSIAIQNSNIVIAPESILEVLRTNSWFNNLPEYLSNALLTSATLRFYADGEMVHYQGDSARGFYAVIQGSVKVSSISTEGRECVFRYLSPGNWFGEIAMLDKSARTHDAKAISPTILLTIAPKELTQILDKYPVFYQSLNILLCKVIRNAFTLINEAALLSVSAQLAKRVLSLAEGYGEPHKKGIQISLYLTQDDLATITNTTRQTINKRLVAWEKLGWIDAKYGKIVLVNIPALKQLSENDED